MALEPINLLRNDVKEVLFMLGSNKNRLLKSLVMTLTVIYLGIFPLTAIAAVESPVAPAVFSTQQAAVDYYLALVEQLDVTTAINKSVFYSGPGNRKQAEAYAIAEDKTTLEMTPGGKVLDDLKLFEQGSPLTPAQATQVWSRLSQRYARQAAGDVFCFVTGARPTGVFTTVELPELKKNRKVGNIYNVSRL
jgi:hypothetical protein